MDVQSQESRSTIPLASPPPGEPPAEERPGDPTIKAVAAWINQFGRTLKTCRLYHAKNPTVIRFREELTLAVKRLTDELGAVTYKFTAADILFGEVSLYPAKSRDDNLGLSFHRDGVRGLTFNPGITAREMDAVVDAVLMVTGQSQIDDDLVTLLWQANLHHVDVDYVPAEGDVGVGIVEEVGELVPWPTAEGDGGPDQAGDASAADADGGSRSDDWTTGDLAVEIEAGFEELATMAPHEVGRFHDEFAAEHEVSLMTTALAIAHAYVDAGATAQDRVELAQFLPRMLRLAIGSGSWLEAREALALLRECSIEEWSVESFTQELFQPISITSTVELLDRQDPAQVAEFVALARELGEPAVEWLTLALSESQHRITRRILAEATASLCRDHPERLVPWLKDSRWYVVRNAVHILGWIGGEAIVNLLQPALRHPDPRVRHEVAAALGQADRAAARPLLLELLPGADTRLFCSILQQLAFQPDAATARLLVSFLRDPVFEQRPNDEKRAIYSALAVVGTDDVLPDLEAELAKGTWLARGADMHRQAIARCVARIGTPRARALLERGAESKRAPVRAACAEALKRIHVHD